MSKKPFWHPRTFLSPPREDPFSGETPTNTALDPTAIGQNASSECTCPMRRLEIPKKSFISDQLCSRGWKKHHPETVRGESAIRKSWFTSAPASVMPRRNLINHIIMSHWRVSVISAHDLLVNQRIRYPFGHEPKACGCQKPPCTWHLCMPCKNMTSNLPPPGTVAGGKILTGYHATLPRASCPTNRRRSSFFTIPFCPGKTVLTPVLRKRGYVCANWLIPRSMH